jgi:acyl carrier protein
MSIEILIRNFILENFLYSNNGNQLRNDDSFLEHGIVDSTGVVELVMFVEETFDIDVPDEDVVPENFDSVQALVCYIQQKTGETMADAPPR